VRVWSKGLRVGGLRPAAANSVVSVLPMMRAPAARSVSTSGASALGRLPKKIGELWQVGMSRVSMMSLIPTGTP